MITNTRRKQPQKRNMKVARVPSRKLAGPKFNRFSETNYNFKRSYTVSQTTTGGLAYGAASFLLSNLPGYTEFTALFDQYRLNCVVANFVWRSSGLSTIETANNNLVGMPIMYSVIDLDDATAPASISEIQEYGKHKTTYFSTSRRHKSFKIYPRNLNTIYRSGVTSAYTLGRRKAWLDITTTDTPHYGFKWAIDVPQGGGTVVESSFDIVYTIYVQFRQSR